MRLKVLEAMARGKAVVTTPRGTEGFAHFGPDLPLAVGADAEAIAAACAGLLEDREERRKLGTAARSFCELHCSPTAWAGRLERIYIEVGNPDQSGMTEA
jgi:glycosyltransferase involved in cell wall biosynthesis